MTNLRPTERFSDRADAYSRHRPSYPREALDALLQGLGREVRLVVADVGAGTGISANLLAQRVGQVIAIEPNAQMRERAPRIENVTWSDGTAEHLPLPDKHVDVVAAFQAFHWFDPVAAFDEFTRVARRRIGMVQYERDELQPFSAAYAEIVRKYMVDDTEARRLRAIESFAQIAGARCNRHVVRFSQTLTMQGVIGRVDSSSYLPREGQQATALREEMREIFRGFEYGGVVEMAMLAYVLYVLL